MAFSTDITLSGSFVNLNSVSGLATNLNFIRISMKGESSSFRAGEIQN